MSLPCNSKEFTTPIGKTQPSSAQTHECLTVDTPNRFKHYRNAAGEFTCLQPKWKESEEKEWGWEGESTEKEKEEEGEAEALPETEVEVKEEEDLKQEENVLKEEEEQIYQITVFWEGGVILQTSYSVLVISASVKGCVWAVLKK